MYETICDVFNYKVSFTAEWNDSKSVSFPGIQ